MSNSPSVGVQHQLFKVKVQTENLLKRCSGAWGCGFSALCWQAWLWAQQRWFVLCVCVFVCDSECICVVSVCDPVLGDHGSMVRFLCFSVGPFCGCNVFWGFFIAYLCMCAVPRVRCRVDYSWSVWTVTHTASHNPFFFFLKGCHLLLSWCLFYVALLQAVLLFHSTFLRIFIQSIRTRWFPLLTLSLPTSLRLSKYKVFVELVFGVMCSNLLLSEVSIQLSFLAPWLFCQAAPPTGCVFYTQQNSV